MRISLLSEPDQAGLRNWAEHVHGDSLALDGISDIPAAWAWVWFLLRETEDRPEWFPHGKARIMDIIESSLKLEARMEMMSPAKRWRCV